MAAATRFRGGNLVASTAAVDQGDNNAPSQAAAPPTGLPSQCSSPSSMYQLGSVLGNGSFGVVCRAVASPGSVANSSGSAPIVVAIKRVLQDPRYKNRELDVMRQLSHRNVVALRDYFYTEVVTADGLQRYLNLVMEYVPETVYRVLKTYSSRNTVVPTVLVKVYMYQLLRSVGYLHSQGICHRDLKPQNLLVDPNTHVLKLCDFGSAKKLHPGEPSVSYICSRFYRAPELMLGAQHYTRAIDMWSCGCVLGELLLGKPLFPGDTSVDQLVKIIEVLGTPSRRDMRAMNHSYTEFRFPDVRPRSWSQFFGPDTTVPDEAMDLMHRLLQYDPEARIHPYDALAHSFFDELRNPRLVLPRHLRDQSTPAGVVPLPPLFEFSPEEVQEMSPSAREILLRSGGAADTAAASGRRENSSSSARKRNYGPTVVTTNDATK